MITKNITIANKLGLHARASAKFVNVASQYASEIFVIHQEKRVNGKSIMGIMMLAATKGSDICISAEGNDAEDAIAALTDLVNDKFGEGE